MQESKPIEQKPTLTHFVYHPSHEPKIVPDHEYQEHLKAGWYETPADFPKEEEKKAEAVEEKPKAKKPRAKKAEAKKLVDLEESNED